MLLCTLLVLEFDPRLTGNRRRTLHDQLARMFERPLPELHQVDRVTLGVLRFNRESVQLRRVSNP